MHTITKVFLYSERQMFSVIALWKYHSSGLMLGFDELGLTTSVTLCGDASNMNDSQELNFVVTGQVAPSELPVVSCKFESQQQQVRIPKVSLGRVGANCSSKNDYPTEDKSSLVVTNCLDPTPKFYQDGDVTQDDEMLDITGQFCEAVKSMIFMAKVILFSFYS